MSNDQIIVDKNLCIGKIIEVEGSHIQIELDRSIKELTKVYNSEVYNIGQFGSIIKANYGSRLIFLFVTKLRLKTEFDEEGNKTYNQNDDTRIIEAEIFGEGRWQIDKDDKPILKFERGVTNYPLPLQKVYLTTAIELKYIYENRNDNTIKLGNYVSSQSIPCFAEADELFSKHTAILGSTGSGKSATTASVIHSIEDFINNDTSWHPHIIILDPHNEYKKSFPKASHLSTDSATLKLPHWLLNLNELTNLIIGKTEFQATSQINILKKALLECRSEGATTIGINKDDINVDSPIPFSIDELYTKIDDDKPTQASKQDKHNSILNKLDILRNDSRLNFMITKWESKTDDIEEIINQFISFKESVKIIDISGIPSDVAGIVTSMISRMLFLYKVWQKKDERAKDPILFVCEEAHRYVPNRGEALYSSAQESIKSIAKEGRKYGLGLMLVSQRPSEIEPTVLSQCSSWIVLRLSNNVDQAFVTHYLPDNFSNLSKILSSLRRREAILVGQAFALPARILINQLSDEQLPESEDVSFINGWQTKEEDKNEIKNVINRWRLQKKE